jgi:hypothetical protein
VEKVMTDGTRFPTNLNQFGMDLDELANSELSNEIGVCIGNDKGEFAPFKYVFWRE